MFLASGFSDSELSLLYFIRRTERESETFTINNRIRECQATASQNSTRFHIYAAAGCRGALLIYYRRSTFPACMGAVLTLCYYKASLHFGFVGLGSSCLRGDSSQQRGRAISFLTGS